MKLWPFFAALALLGPSCARADAQTMGNNDRFLHTFGAGGAESAFAPIYGGGTMRINTERPALQAE